VQALATVIIQLVGDAGLDISQVEKNEPFTDFEHFGFEARPETFGLCIIVVITPAALRAQGLVVVE
jgi:hypothetical protein